jgi:hypothetical protein
VLVIRIDPSARMHSDRATSSGPRRRVLTCLAKAMDGLGAMLLTTLSGQRHGRLAA